MHCKLVDWFLYLCNIIPILDPEVVKSQGKLMYRSIYALGYLATSIQISVLFWALGGLL